MWMSFFLSGFPAAVMVMLMKHIPGTKAVGCIYTIAFIIRVAADVVPSSNTKPPSRVSVHGSGLQSFLTGSIKRRKQMKQMKQMTQKAEARAQICSWYLQLCGYLAQLAITLWIPSVLISPTIDRLFPHLVESVHWHGMKYVSLPLPMGARKVAVQHRIQHHRHFSGWPTSGPCGCTTVYRRWCHRCCDRF